jgi:hypothetical protein
LEREVDALSAAFRRPTEPAPQEDEIPDALLESVPIEGEEIQTLHIVPEPQGPAAPRMSGAADDVLAEVRREMEAAFAQQLTRVESSFASILKDMDQKLAFAQAELDMAKRENERVKTEHQRKVDTLRALKKSLEQL